MVLRCNMMATMDGVALRRETRASKTTMLADRDPVALEEAVSHLIAVAEAGQ